MFIKSITITVAVLLGVATVSAEEISVLEKGGWNIGTPAHSIELDAGSRYLLRFNINCRVLDRYGAIFLITKGSAGGQNVASVYPGAFNEFNEISDVIEVASDAVDAKLHFGSHGTADYTVKDIRVVKLEDFRLVLELPNEESTAIFDPSDGCRLKFSVANQSGADYQGMLQAQMVDVRNPTEVQELGLINAAIKSNASQTFDLGAFKAPAGFYVLRVFSADGTVFMEHNIAMSVPNKSWADDEADRVFFGLHMPHYALWDFPTRSKKLKAAHLLEHIGVGIARIKMPWHEDADGTLNFHSLDEALAILQERNIQVLAEIPNTIPRQYITSPKPPTKEELKKVAPWLNLDQMLSPTSWHTLSVRPSDMDALARFATALAEKLKTGGVRYIELGNEPDWWDYFMGDFQDYSDTYTIKVEAMKKVNPDFKFMNGGLTLMKAVDEQFLEKLLVVQSNRLDAVAFHSYDRPCDELVGKTADGSPTKLTELKKKMRDAAVDKPIWMTEGNVYTQTEYTVAKEIAKKFAIYKLHGVDNYTCYRAITDDHLGFQMMNHNLEPMLSAVAYSAAVRFLRNKAATAAELPEGFSGIQCEDVSVVWADVENCAEQRMFRKEVGQAVIVYDFLGKKITESESGSLSLKLGSEPVFIVSE